MLLVLVNHIPGGLVRQEEDRKKRQGMNHASPLSSELSSDGELKQDSDLYLDKAEYVRQAENVVVWVWLPLGPCTRQQDLSLPT
jgi:hypothetical protein